MMTHNVKENKVPADFGDDWNGEPCQHKQVSLQAHNQKVLFRAVQEEYPGGGKGFSKCNQQIIPKRNFQA